MINYEKLDQILKSGKQITPAKFKEHTGVDVITAHTGKMEGLNSLSTFCGCNAKCIARMKNSKLICCKCFAASVAKRYSNVSKKLARHTEVLTGEIIPVKYWPLLNDRFYRLEAFGDLNNGVQAANYINFAKKNKNTVFAWWTKNLAFVKQGLEILGLKQLPKNVVLIFSDPLINGMDEKIIEKLVDKYPFVNKIFTVYDKKYIDTNHVDINCGARSCLTCGRCYHKTKNLEFVKEKLK